MNTVQQVLGTVRNLFIWWVVVAPWEQAVRVRLGKHMEVLGAGVHLRIPWVDRIAVQAVRLRTTDTGLQTLTTLDGHTVFVAATIKFEIDDIGQMYQSVHNVMTVVIDLAAASIAQFVTTRDRADVSPMELQEFVTEDLDLAQFGLAAGLVAVTDFAFVRTYRMVTDQRQWRPASGVSTYLPRGLHDMDGPV